MSVVALWLKLCCCQITVGFPLLCCSFVCTVNPDSVANLRSDMSQQKNKRLKIALNYPQCAISKGNNDGKAKAEWMKQHSIAAKRSKTWKTTIISKSRLLGYSKNSILCLLTHQFVKNNTSIEKFRKQNDFQLDLGFWDETMECIGLQILRLLKSRGHNILTAAKKHCHLTNS